jgi:hypothetical protein
MNRRELKHRLVSAGVPEGDYFITGIDSQLAPGKGGGFGELVITSTEDGRAWRLVSEERGQVRYQEVYATEEEACEAAWETLKPGDQTIRDRTPEERSQARARAHEAVAEYEKISQDYRDRGRHS